MGHILAQNVYTGNKWNRIVKSVKLNLVSSGLCDLSILFIDNFDTVEYGWFKGPCPSPPLPYICTTFTRSAYSSTLKKEAAVPSVSRLTTYQATWHHITDDCNLHRLNCFIVFSFINVTLQLNNPKLLLASSPRLHYDPTLLVMHSRWKGTLYRA
jgi:hypothetical protein